MRYPFKRHQARTAVLDRPEARPAKAAEGTGGAMRLYGGTATITGTSFDANSATRGGAAHATLSAGPVPSPSTKRPGVPAQPGTPTAAFIQ